MALALLIGATTALVIVAVVTVINVMVMRRLGNARSSHETPLVSVLIPARNEAGVIARTVQGLLSQTYEHFEILLLDDHSSDGTGETALAAAEGDSRLRVLTGLPLPEEWLGKNWACQQLSDAACGEVLVFTDADVIWKPGALRALLNEMAHTQADLLTIWPTQYTQTWGERLVVPLMALAILGYLPLLLVHFTRWPVFAAANGQCLAFRRRAYEQVGSHTAVKNRIVEDVALARLVKAHGLRLRMADGTGLITCQMYQNWGAVQDGFAKNILAGHGGSILFLAASTAFHWLVFVFPWWWLLAGWPDRFWPLALVILGVGVRTLSAAATRQRIMDGLFMPVSVMLMTLIAARSVYWRLRFGGPRWKDRTILVEGAFRD